MSEPNGCRWLNASDQMSTRAPIIVGRCRRRMTISRRFINSCFTSNGPMRAMARGPAARNTGFVRSPAATQMGNVTARQRGTFVLLLFRLGFAEAAGGTPWPIGFRNGLLLGWVATGVREPVLTCCEPYVVPCLVP